MATGNCAECGVGGTPHKKKWAGEIPKDPIYQCGQCDRWFCAEHLDAHVCGLDEEDDYDGEDEDF